MSSCTQYLVIAQKTSRNLLIPPIKNGVKYHVFVRTKWKACKTVVLVKNIKATIAAALDRL